MKTGALRNAVLRNMILLSAGKSVSLLGSSVYTFAMGLYVLNITGSGLRFAITLVLGILPVILVNPIAGLIADRGNRKYVVIAADLLNAFLLFMLLLYCRLAGLTIVSIYISTFLLNTVAVVFDITLEASIPDLVPGENLMGLNSANKAIEATTSVLGPMLGGIVYALIDIRAFVAVNAISFLLSAIMEAFVDFELGKPDSAQMPAARTDKPVGNNNIAMDFRDGLVYLRGNREIFGVFLFLAGLNFFIGISVLVPLPYLLNHVFQIGSANYGLVQSAFPIGSFIGALLIQRWNTEKRYARILFKASVALSCSIVLIGVPPVFGTNMAKTVLIVWYSCIMAVMGLSAAAVDIPLIYMLQIRLPGTVRGRVLSLGMSLVKTASPLAYLSAGLLISVLPFYLLPMAGGLLLLLYSIGYRNWMAKSGGQNPESQGEHSVIANYSD